MEKISREIEVAEKNENSSIKYFDPLCVPDLWGHWQPAPLELLNHTIENPLFAIFKTGRVDFEDNLS